MPILYRTDSRWIAVKVVDKVVCDGCRKPILAAALSGDSPLAASGALEIILRGGFGQFFDGKDVKVLFCKGCAEKLCKRVPSFGRLILERGEGV